MVSVLSICSPQDQSFFYEWNICDVNGNKRISVCGHILVFLAVIKIRTTRDSKEGWPSWWQGQGLTWCNEDCCCQGDDGENLFRPEKWNTRDETVST